MGFRRVVDDTSPLHALQFLRSSTESIDSLELLQLGEEMQQERVQGSRGAQDNAKVAPSEETKVLTCMSRIR